MQREQEDIIGDVYTSWVPQDARRTLGQFWTPRPIAQLMTRWAIQSPNDCVLDPAFGSGILLLTATDRLAHLGTPARTILRQMAGAELSPLVFLMGLTNVLLQHVPRARLRLQWGDFLMPKREPYTVLKESPVTYAVRVGQMALPGMKRVLQEGRPLVFLELHGPEAATQAKRILQTVHYDIHSLKKGFPNLPYEKELDWKMYLIATPEEKTIC